MNPLRDALRRLLSPPWLDGLIGVQALLLVLIVVGHLALLPDERTAAEPETGDYLAFFVAGRMVVDGQGAQLYDAQAQGRVQESIQDGPRPYRQRYLNPPGMALAVAPTTLLGYRPAFIAFSAAAFAAWGLSAALLAGTLPAFSGQGLRIALAGLALPTFVRTLGGGQNTGFSVLGLALCWATTRHWAWGALGLGLLSYKPQHALIGLVLVAGLRSGRALAGGAALWVLHFLVGVALCGPDWLIAFLANARDYAALEDLEGQLNHVSLPRALGAALGPWGQLGGGVWGLALVLGAFGALWRSPVGRQEAPAAMVVLAAALASPHLQYYDAWMALVPVLLVLHHRARSAEVSLGERLLVVVAALAGELWAPAATWGIQPVPVALLALLGWAAMAHRADATTAHGIQAD